MKPRVDLNIPLQVDTLGPHGDTPGAALRVRQLRAGLERGGVAVKPAWERSAA